MTPGELFIWTFTVCGCAALVAGTVALIALGTNLLIREIEK